MHFSTARLRTRLHTTFTALHYQNYRTYLFGFFISNSGMLAQQTAAGYLIYDLTGSSTYLGYFGFAQGFAFIILALFSGLIADRVSRRKMLAITQCGMLLQAALLTALTFSGVIQAWHVIALTFVQGIIKALDSPNRLSFITNLVDHKDIINAIPLHSTTINSALILGPIVAGVLYNLIGPGWVFLFDALTYIPFIIMLLRMRTTHENDHLVRKHTAAWTEIREGLHYAFSNQIIRLLLVSMVIYNIFGLSIRNLSPAWAADILHGDAQTNSWLVGGIGFGAVMATLIIAGLSFKRVRGKLRFIGGYLYALAFVVMALFQQEWVSILMFALMGLAGLLVTNNTQGIIQTRISDNMRGRVIGLFTMMFMGGLTIGSLLVGYMADWLGEANTILVCGMILLLLTVYLWLRKKELRGLA